MIKWKNGKELRPKPSPSDSTQAPALRRDASPAPSPTPRQKPCTTLRRFPQPLCHRIQVKMNTTGTAKTSCAPNVCQKPLDIFYTFFFLFNPLNLWNKHSWSHFAEDWGWQRLNNLPKILPLIITEPVWPKAHDLLAIPGFLSLRPPTFGGWIILYCLVHYKMLRSTLDLCALDASTNPLPWAVTTKKILQTLPNISWRTKLPPVKTTRLYHTAYRQK